MKQESAVQIMLARDAREGIGAFIEKRALVGPRG